VLPEVDLPPPPLTFCGWLTGCCRLSELLLELELLPELAEFEDPLVEEFDEPLVEEFDEPLVEEPDALLSGDVLDTDACVEPGSTAITMPAAATEAKDTVMVVALRRRRPCSRSATARAIWRPRSSQLFMALSLPLVAVSILRKKSQQAMKLSTRNRAFCRHLSG
jgi:hypothetical protein